MKISRLITGLSCLLLGPLLISGQPIQGHLIEKERIAIEKDRLAMFYGDYLILSSTAIKNALGKPLQNDELIDPEFAGSNIFRLWEYFIGPRRFEMSDSDAKHYRNSIERLIVTNRDLISAHIEKLIIYKTNDDAKKDFDKYRETGLSMPFGFSTFGNGDEEGFLEYSAAYRNWLKEVSNVSQK